MRHHYESLLISLAEEIGLDPPSLLATEEIVIDSLPISLQLEGSGDRSEVLLSSLLGTVPAARWDQVSRTLLLANHAGLGTRGGMLGVVPKDGETVTLSMRRPLLNLDADKLATLLGWVTDTSLAWKEYISDEGQAEPPEFFQKDLRAYS